MRQIIDYCKTGSRRDKSTSLRNLVNGRWVALIFQIGIRSLKAAKVAGLGPVAPKVKLYVAHRFWFDALTTVAALRCQNSSDPSGAELVQAIGLERLATEAIVTS